MQKRIWLRELAALSAWIVPLLFFAASPSVWIEPGAPVSISGPVLGHAVALVSSTDSVMTPFAALGAPSFPICIRCSARLNSGQIVLDLGADSASGRAHSLIVYGLDRNYRGHFLPSEYRVSVSTDLITWHFLGVGSGISQWQSKSWSGDPFRYVLLEDFQEGGRWGAQIDAVEIRG